MLGNIIPTLIMFWVAIGMAVAYSFKSNIGHQIDELIEQKCREENHSDPKLVRVLVYVIIVLFWPVVLINNR